jgi:hypothetical protein
MGAASTAWAMSALRCRASIVAPAGFAATTASSRVGNAVDAASDALLTVRYGV